MLSLFYVLSSYLFAVYVDDLITQLRQSGHGMHVGQLFVSCALCADRVCVDVCIMLWFTESSTCLPMLQDH